MGSDVVPRHKYRKARIVTQTSKFQPILAGLVESPASARMAQTGTPPPIRIAGTGFRGTWEYEKIPKSGNRTQIGRPEFLTSVSRIGFLSQLRAFATSTRGRESRLQDRS